jgi:glycosyltransferase involved in cell wall biosynthesis
MTERFTVLQVIPRMRAGGAELGCLQVAEALVRAGHRALVASEGGRMVEALEAAGARHITLPLASKNPLQVSLNALRLGRILRREGVDIIHARSRAPAWSALWAASATETAFVTTYHSEYGERGRIKNFYNGVMARSDKVIAVSDYMAHLIRTRYGTPDHRIAVIHRAFDPERFDRDAVAPERLDAMRRHLEIAPGDRVLLLAGRITRRKAQHDLVEALGRLAKSGTRDWVCVFAGEVEKPEYLAKLKSSACNHGIADRLRFPGHVADMAALYLVSAVSFNISEQEGLPRVALESQAMGVPVILSDTGPGREVALTPPETPLAEATGLRVPYADPQRLCEAITTLLSWPEAERGAMGARGARHVRARFSLARLTESTLAIYREVLAARATRPRP